MSSLSSVNRSSADLSGAFPIIKIISGHDESVIKRSVFDIKERFAAETIEEYLVRKLCMLHIQWIGGTICCYAET